MRLAVTPSLFPAFVAQYSVTFDPDGDGDVAALELPAALARAAPKRRNEYRAGRFCARMALRARAPQFASEVVHTGARGEPLWPPGIVGAITHTRGFASAAIALATDARGIGIDVEWLADDDVDEIRRYVVAPEELAGLVRSTGWNTTALVGVAFSAKETLFKCLSPEVQRYFDFRDATLDALDPARGTFSARLVVSLTPQLFSGKCFEGRFERRRECVYTAMVLQ